MLKFRPSQAAHWGKCAAFQRFTLNSPVEDETDAAREGTCAAWLAETVINGTDDIKCSDFIGKPHENGWVIDAQMVSFVQDYVNLVRSFGGKVYAEEHVVASEKPSIEGTLDASIVLTDDRILHIIDLKYGRRVVETTTPQLICYGYAKLKNLDENSIDEVHLSIYQPRAFHHDGIYRTRIVKPQQLRDEFMKLLEMAVEGEKPDSIATPGTHCLNCAAATKCEALAHTTYNLVSVVHSRNQRNMTPQELSRELDFMNECKKTIDARLKAVEAEALSRAKLESIPGWGLTFKKGNRAFTVSGAQIELLTGIDPRSDKLCTPAELERRGATKEQLKNITEQPVTTKLVKITDNDIANMFDAEKRK